VKKFIIRNLLLFAGILWISVGIISDDMGWGYSLGFAFIALDIAIRIKDSYTENTEEVASTDNEEINKP